MLAINDNNQVVEKPDSPALTLVKNTNVKTGMQCLEEIRGKLNSKLRNPAYIFDCLLTAKQRETLCFAAGLKRSDCATNFVDLTLDARQAIQKAILMLGQVFCIFNEAQAVSPSKFVQAKRYSL